MLPTCGEVEVDGRAVQHSSLHVLAEHIQLHSVVPLGLQTLKLELGHAGLHGQQGQIEWVKGQSIAGEAGANRGVPSDSDRVDSPHRHADVGHSEWCFVLPEDGIMVQELIVSKTY